MALFQIGGAGAIGNQIANAVGSNAVTNALGMDFGTILTPSKFLTKFTPSTVFAYRSLAYEIQSSKNFDVIFHWFPRCSQIRSMFANAFSAADANEINLLVRDVQMPNITSGNMQRGNDTNRRFACAFPGSGVNGEGPLTMRFLNTEFSYVHHCFYQWLCETESPFWLYGPGMSASKEENMTSRLEALGKLLYPKEKQSLKKAQTWMSYDDASKLPHLISESECSPFTRADIEIKMYSGNMKELHSIWFMGAFPAHIALGGIDHTPTSQQTLEGHTVSFAYDSMCISSPFVYNNGDNLTSSVAKAAQNLKIGESAIGTNSAEWTAGLYDDTLTQIGNTYLAKASRRLNSIMNKAGSKVSDNLKTAQSKLTA